MLKESFSSAGISSRDIIIPHGEKQKSFDKLIKIVNNLLVNNISRETVLYA